ncbi:MAG: Hpt domain-containing protein, partial [Candidatus Latescibacterota bacterium]
MNRPDEMLLSLLATFTVEAAEHLQVLSSGLLELEGEREAGRQREIVETVFREAHSLKGAARAVDLADVAGLCQSLESVLAALKRQEVALSPGLLDLLHQGVMSLAELLARPGTQRPAAQRAA